MALRERPGTEVWAVSPEGKRSEFGLWVYLPEDRGYNFPQIGIAVIRQNLEKTNWFPWLGEISEAQKKSGKYNPRVFCYIDAIPNLVDALQKVYASHRPGKSRAEVGPSLQRALEEQRKEDAVDEAVRAFGEFK